jgi:hypothetical protein
MDTSDRKIARGKASYVQSRRYCALLSLPVRARSVYLRFHSAAWLATAVGAAGARPLQCLRRRQEAGEGHGGGGGRVHRQPLLPQVLPQRGVSLSLSRTHSYCSDR